MKVSQLASLFEIRSVIAAVLGLIGAFLIFLGIVGTTDNEHLVEAAREINSNLWAGLALIVVSIAMLLWMKVDPAGGAAPKDEDDETQASAKKSA